VGFKVAVLTNGRVMWELSHIAEQHPTASTDIHIYNKSTARDIHGYDNQQFEISTVTINNNRRV
jgi:hypothetical protein